MNKDDSWKQLALSLAETKALSWRGIARELGVAKSTVSDMLRAYYKMRYQDAPVQTNLVPKGARILLLDIETAPTAAFVWGRWQQNVHQKQVIKEGYVLTYSAKWLGEPTIISGRITIKGDDSQIIKELSELMNTADIIIAHNAMKFDIPLIKTRMLALGLPPIMPAKVVDTLKIAKAEFKFPSNSLDNIAAYLGLDRKVSHSGFELWERCMAMEEEAFNEMLEYNIQDVIVLEQVYLKLRAWSKTHPNTALYEDNATPRCVCCGSHSLTPIDKVYATQSSTYNVLVCNDCGKTNRTRKNTYENGKTLLSNTGK
jgi:DNA polymerase elongation subunit (family B)